MRSARFSSRNAAKNDRKAASPTSSAGSNTETPLVNSVARRKKKTFSGFLNRKKTSPSPQPTNTIIATPATSASETQTSPRKWGHHSLMTHMTTPASSKKNAANDG